MKNNDTTQKILIIAIVIVSVCIVGVLAIATSLLLPEVFPSDLDERIKTSKPIDVTNESELEITRTQQLEALKVLNTDSDRVRATSTQQDQRAFLETLSQ